MLDIVNTLGSTPTTAVNNGDALVRVGRGSTFQRLTCTLGSPGWAHTVEEAIPVGMVLGILVNLLRRTGSYHHCQHGKQTQDNES